MDTNSGGGILGKLKSGAKGLKGKVTSKVENKLLNCKYHYKI